METTIAQLFITLIIMLGAGNAGFCLAPKHCSRAGFALALAGFAGFYFCALFGWFGV